MTSRITDMEGASTRDKELAVAVMETITTSDPDPEFQPPWSEREVYVGVRSRLGSVTMAEIRGVLSSLSGYIATPPAVNTKRRSK